MSQIFGTHTTSATCHGFGSYHPATYIGNRYCARPCVGQRNRYVILCRVGIELHYSGRRKLCYRRATLKKKVINLEERVDTIGVIGKVGAAIAHH